MKKLPIIESIIKKEIPNCPFCQQELVITGWMSSTGPDSASIGGYNTWYIECTSCKAKWETEVFTTQFKRNEPFMRLVRNSTKNSEKGYYIKNSWLPINFWNVERFGKIEKAFPVAYFEGNPTFDQPSNGSIVLYSDALFFVTHKGMNVEIRWEDLSIAELVTQREVKWSRIILFGVWGSLWKKTEYILRIKFFENEIERTYIFVPEKWGASDYADELQDVKSSMVWDIRSLWEELNHKIKRKERKKEPSKEEVLDPLKILQLRYAKGEITKEQYEEMKNVLQS